MVGLGNNPHTIRFLTNLKGKLPNLKIDFFDYGTDKNLKCKILCDNVYTQFKIFTFIGRVFSKIFKLKFVSFFSFWFRILLIRNQYDIVNVHFAKSALYWAIKQLKKKGKNLVFTPWGSDVLRQDAKNIELLKQIYKYADYVTASKNGFRIKVQNILNVNEDKFYDVGFGSDMLDLIAAKETLTKDEAKIKMNFEGKFIITVGYNANPAHHHIEIIEQIQKVREQLPKNILIILPMSYYVASKQYIIDVKELLNKYKLEYYCFETYISNDELLLLRKCSDVFIHAQTTDAASASLTEYLLTDNIVLNASWLDYPQLEQFGMPYYKFDTLEDVGNLLVYAINNPNEHIPNAKLKEYIKSLGWNCCSTKWADFFRKIANQ